jgi:acetate kinase
MMVLVLNAGSSSQKSCLYRLGELLPDTPTEPLTQPLWSAHLDWTVADDRGLLTVTSNDIQQELPITQRNEALEVLLKTLIEGETRVIDSFEQIDLVGHRVVHGGAKYSEATVITAEVKDAIADLIPLAPNHNPTHLEGIEAIEALLPNVSQVAVFDTAFHTTIPEPAKVYPLPYEWYEQGIQRYGFHGISHQYCAHRAAQILHQPLESLKIITCHLGNGCSLAAIQDGICVDTTMGFSPLEGLMMGTRCGSIDPQILLYLMQEYGLNVEAINRLLNQESGLLGVSGVSGDMREINQAIAAGNQRASLALEVYIHRLKSSIGAMVASLNGLDVLVFTGGVGENAAIVREKTCEGLSYLGLQLDLVKNQHHPVDCNVATDNSSREILVIHTQEDWAIAIAAASTVA